MSEAVDYESMSQEDLEKLDIDVIGSMDPDVDTTVVPARETPEATDDMPVDTADTPVDAKVETDKADPDKPVEPVEPTEPVEPEQKVDRNDEPITSDPLKDTQAELSRKQTALSKAMQENDDLKRRLEEKDIDMPEKLSEEELDDLADTDPRAYREYVDKMASATAKKESLDVQRQEHVTQTMYGNLQTVIKELWQVDLDLSKPYELQTVEAQRLIDTGKLQKFDDFIMANYKPNSDGIFTVDQLRGAQKALFFDDMVAMDREKTRNTVVDDMKKAGTQTSVLDTHPGESQRTKSVDDYSQAEIDKMSPAQLDEILKAEGIRI